MTKRYFSKFKAEEQSPDAPHIRHTLHSSIGGLIAIGLVALLSKAAHTPLVIAPFGATCVLAFGIPESPLAQPRNIIGGHFIAALVGLICSMLFGAEWYSLAIGVSLSMALMQITKTTHPPAGANPLIIILTGAKWSFLFSPVLAGALIIVIVALVFNNSIKTRRYPKYWI